MGDSTEIRPFRIAVPKPIWTIWPTDWHAPAGPTSCPGPAGARGVPLDYLKELAAYWGLTSVGAGRKKSCLQLTTLR